MIHINPANIAEHWGSLDKVSQCEALLALQEFGMRRAELAECLPGVKPSLIKDRLSDARAYKLGNKIPSGKIQVTVDREDVLRSEMDRRDRVREARDARTLVTDEVVQAKAAEMIREFFATERAALLAQLAEVRKAPAAWYSSDPPKIEEAWQHISDLHHCRIFKDTINESVTANALATYREHTIKLTELQRKHAVVDILNIAFIGDLMHGTANYPYQDREVTGNSSYQIARTAKLLIDHVLLMMKHFPYIRVNFVAGNHGRKDRLKNVINDNYEIDMARVVQAFFEGVDGVEVYVEDTEFYAIANSMGRKILLMHGDSIKAGNPQGLIDAIRRYQDTLPYFDDVLMGHWHRQMMLPLPRRFGTNISRFLYVNGTASIDDQFLESFGSSPSLGWWFLFCNGKRFTATYAVDLFQDSPAVAA